MEKAKRTLGLDKKSLEILMKKQREIREERESHTDKLLSKLIEKAILTFYEVAHIRLEPHDSPVAKRQTVYLSKSVNAKFNELMIRYRYKSKELANLVIKEIYAD